MAAEAKAQGNKYYSQGDYINAIEMYSKAIKLNSSDHTYFSNRSAAHFALGNFEVSIEDARKCIEISPKWVKVSRYFLFFFFFLFSSYFLFSCFVFSFSKN